MLAKYAHLVLFPVTAIRWPAVAENDAPSGR
jgi:hypothetical protein